jgi:hypothetical protein
MAQRDYLLRQIEMLGEILIAIRKMILGGGAKAGEVGNRLKEVSEKVGMDLELARASSPETLRFLVAPTGEVEPGRCWMLAETLYLDGLYAETEGDEARWWDSLEKARMLFKLLGPMGAFLVGFPEAEERIREIDKLLSRNMETP